MNGGYSFVERWRTLKGIPEQIAPGDLSPMKGTDMLSQLVKFQAKVSALRSDRGATAVEYGLMVALIAAVIIVTVGLLGGKVEAAFQSIVTNMP